MKKFLILCAFCFVLSFGFTSCEDPMESMAPVQETPQLTTDTGTGSGPEKDKPGGSNE